MYTGWTGILFPFQYSDDREELEGYLGSQVVSSLMEIAKELKKVKGNYCRSMVDSMYYLLRCYLFEKEQGKEHPKWLEAVIKFCDKLVEIQNEDGSWNRGYSMEGVPLTNPPQWFGASKKEQGSGAIFPAQILTALYSLTKLEKYLKSAERAAYFVYGNYASQVEYIGGLNDTTHKKSVKIDAVGSDVCHAYHVGGVRADKGCEASYRSKGCSPHTGKLDLPLGHPV